MSDEINFCLFCGAPGHKILEYDEKLHFCRECNKFFEVEKKEPVCPKCDSTKIEDSDFPSPEGNIIFQCKSCKKMFSAKELLEK